MKTLWVLGLLCCWLPLLVHGNKCPPPEDIMPCRCRGRNEQIQVWCSHSDLERVNGALENLMKLRSMPAIDELIVENNRMPTLPARAFGALRIGRLLLRNNGLESISRNAFAGLEQSIEELYIVEDKLVDFPFDSIENLKNLEAFTIEKSRIRLLPRFNGLNRLKHVRIDGSLISSFPVGAFASMASVKQIHVVNSNLGSLAEGIFGPLETLLLANFSGNRIDLIQRRSFALLPKLEVLSIASNNLDDSVAVGRACEELTSLKSLDISKNKFKILPEGSFVNLRTLQMLNLASNKIMQVNARSFTHLPALRKVDMSDNLIRNLPANFFDAAPLLEELRLRKNLMGTANEIGEVLGTLKSLRFLDLGENGLTVLPTGAIQDHTQLQRLDLSDNKITRIQRNAFGNVPSLIEMSLRNNSIREIAVDGDAWDIPSLKELDISSNNIQTLSNVALKGLPRIARMDMSYNSIKMIGKGVFSQSKDLELLDLAGNGVKTFAPDALIGLTKLNKLDLSRNHLEGLLVGTFRDLSSLQSLNLANNRIGNVPANLFSELKSLEDLSLKSNSLKHLPQGFFSALENLKELNLRHNSISEIPGRMFTGLKSLESLKISSNQISRFDDTAFDDLFKLKSIDLSSNRIMRIPGRSFRNLAGLEKFEGRENRITSVDSGALSSSEKLQVLDLAHNALATIPDLIKSNPTLKVLDLSHNQINKIDADVFKRSSNLVELYLNDNKIKAIPSKTFEDMETLTILDVDGNDVEEIQPDTFKNLPRLIYLRLSRNKIRAIRNAAFTDLSTLDGLDLQENDLETIGDSAFERTGALKYLNLSHNNFDSMSRMGLFPLSSLEVLDTSYNRIRDVDSKSLKHLQWLVELRMNDNGICRLPVGIFDGMSRLKMLVLRNNLLSHIYESVFYKLKNNIAFLDISGNPISCDCELAWLRNLVTREAVQELVEATCDSPNDLKGKPIKDVRPSRMICMNNAISRGIPPKFEDEQCPELPKSKRKPRPVILNNNERPFFGTTPNDNNDYSGTDANSNNDIRKKKDEKLSESDYTPGDTPTIYAGSGTSTKVAPSDHVKSTGFGALGTLFGFPLPSLDFGLNLGITPSVTLADKNQNKGTKNEDTDRGFNSGIKGPDPLPPSWLDRPSKDFGKNPAGYEPPEYIPRKPIQPYIPLNPYSDTNVVPSGSRDVQKTVSPLSGSNSGPIRPLKFTPGQSKPPPPSHPSWHPAYPTAETGFIPIEPFFHSVSVANKKMGSKNETIEKVPSVTYASTTPKPNGFNIKPKGTPLPNYGQDYISEVTSNRPDTLNPSPSPSSHVPIDYEDEPNYTPVNVQNPGEDERMEDDFSLSDFWGIISGKENATMETGQPQESPEPQIDIPLNFSNPVDTLSSTTSTSTPNPHRFSSTTTIPVLPPVAEEAVTAENKHGLGHHPPSDAHPRRGKPTITKITMDEVVVPPFPKNPAPNPYQDIIETEAQTRKPPTTATPKGEPSQPQQLIPPVLVGKREEPSDWYYTNYNNQNHGDELERFLERSRINQNDDIVVDVSSSAFTLLPQTLSLVIFNALFLNRYL
ncbi:unnamed protein product [Allacma fusca]|uniref:LRRCT domain-containing protein n=1 Tax=Allacma fusca TaxID=39272 RepID=A0A8J2PCG9_9HEXA|nr:unnamed protein product [Allacma fusca]